MQNPVLTKSAFLSQTAPPQPQLQTSPPVTADPTTSRSIPPTSSSPTNCSKPMGISKVGSDLGKRKCEDTEPKIVKLGRVGQDVKSAKTDFKVKSFEEIIAEKRARQLGTESLQPQSSRPKIERLPVAQTVTGTSTANAPGQRIIRINNTPAPTPTPTSTSSPFTVNVATSPTKRAHTRVTTRPVAPQPKPVSIQAATAAVFTHDEDDDLLSILPPVTPQLSSLTQLAHLFEDDELDKEFDNL